ncbi:MAG: oxidoreductase [Planctomycetes bacterium]|nr:oxidoreductase [Planctomycetota bacterium]
MSFSAKNRILVVGAGHMGISHARAYAKLSGFEICGVVTRTRRSSQAMVDELGPFPQFTDFEHALVETKPDSVSISSYTETHHPFTMAALEAGCHVFVEKPLAENVENAQEIADKAKEVNRKVVVGYILRHHPSWIKFIEIARTMGTPLVMRMNLNQQSKGDNWKTHKNLMKSTSPIVDCGVHYVDVMCQMTRSTPVRVHAVASRLSDEIATDMYNYGVLNIQFKDGSSGWYEAGWGPMMSETAFFVKDAIGPCGCVSIVADEMEKTDSDDVDSHCKTNLLKVHHAQLTEEGEFALEDELISTEDEPGHDELCEREQAYFLKTIREDINLTDHLRDAVNSLAIVLAADQSYREGRAVEL